MAFKRRRTLLTLLAGLVAVVIAGVGVFFLLEEESGKAEPEMPVALGQHLEQLREAAPGHEEPGEGPASAADAEFQKRAYPADTIKVAQVDAAKAAADKAEVRTLSADKAKGRVWKPLGPDQALYPDTDLRNSFSYVPNEYIASGRTTAIAIGSSCTTLRCRLYVTPSGGGLWRTDNALDGRPRWKYLGASLGVNAAGAVTVDSNDRSGNTIYLGTGEANVCGSGCVAGVGLYKSTDGGDTWTGPIGKAELGGKGIGDILVKPGSPKTIYVATTSAMRGMSSVCCKPLPERRVPDAAKWGLYKSTNGGRTWTFIHNGSANAAECTGSQTEFTNGSACSPRGVRHIALDPVNPGIVYASSYARGIWRSPDGGATWTQIKPSLNQAVLQSRAAFDVTRLPNGKTRMYVNEGNNGTNPAVFSRSDDVATGTPAFTTLSSPAVAQPGFATYNLCGGQCWYDNFVHTPPGRPDMVYVGGSYAYGENVANHRAVVLSTDAGVSATDMTFDGTDPLHPNGLHPDQHDIVVNPANPFQFFETNDGGIMRSSGAFVNRSTWCDDPARGLGDTEKARCRQMLSRIPSEIRGVNDGLSTLQFLSLSVDPHNSSALQGGTQDNGTWESGTSPGRWLNTMIGDGGQSGFDTGVKEFRFHNFYDASTEVNFNNGNIADWIWTADPIYGQPGTQFYAPIISDPKVSKTMFAGTAFTAYRTKTAGLGDRTLAEADRICNSWTGTYEAVCGDWAELGPNRLTAAVWGDRAGGAVAAIERTVADTSTAWSATSTGRVFLSRNVDAEPASSVSWTRLDDDAPTPNRFPSSIYVDPANGNHAWISYSGFNSNTTATPGHVFEVTYNPGTGTSSWTDLSGDLGDVPVNDLVRDDVTGDLYAANDFGVLRLPSGSTGWTGAAAGMPNLEVAGLTILPGERLLYAASHGLGAWKLTLN
ncbi:WD40/YVTN/BNR-like repeat-containing protein [Sphaerisporangium perillae]|uniref:WD40/YVTN/BNR-like repeat-containing protein n=1 Tax=Sphaerisporangium perillae TaxID=2935860 RepID=UPI00200F8603|nr:sialidase family protein [Sphaerisporangium perillae]